VHRRLVERDDEDGARLRVLERGELLQRRPGAVVLDRELVEQARVGAAGADAREVLLEDLEALSIFSSASNIVSSIMALWLPRRSVAGWVGG
jgi:hypothetical protein